MNEDSHLGQLATILRLNKILQKLLTKFNGNIILTSSVIGKKTPPENRWWPIHFSAESVAADLLA
jgi:hypothetical protein